MAHKGRILFLGQIPEKFNPDKHIPLGPFCFANKESVYKELAKIDFIDDPFDSIDSLKAAEAKCNKYALDMLKIMTVELNKKMNLNYSMKFWKVIIFPWLIYAIQSTYERQIRIRNFIQLHDNENLHVILVSDNINWCFNTCLDYIDNGIQNVVYNEWLYSRIIEHNIPNNWSFEYVDRSNNKEYQNLSTTTTGLLSKLKSSRILSLRKGFSRVFGVYGFKWYDYFIFNVVLQYIYMKGKILKKSLSSTSYITDIKAEEIDWDFDFRMIIDNIVPRFIYNIPGTIESVKQKKYHTDKMHIVSASQITNTDNDLKVKFALRYEYGEKILPVQHGGHNYGTSLLNSISSMVEYNHFRYITWGWTSQENYNGHFVPLPSPLLSYYSNRYKRTNCKIIMVGNYMNYYFISFTGSPQAKQQLSYRENKVIFINHLLQSVKTHLYYRPYLYNQFSFEDGEYILSKNRTIKILHSNVHSEIMNCRLLVLDHPGTTLSIAIAMNVPFVCFWNLNHFPFSSQAEFILSRLAELGIFYNNPVDAAKKVNTVSESVDEWWSCHEIQDFRKVLLSEYGIVNKNWRYHWFKYLDQIHYEKE